MDERMRRPAGAAIGAAYAAQGLGYAAVVTSLPSLKDQVRIDDVAVAVIVLGVSVAAAVGSVLADLIAVRAGSRAALVTGLLLQAAALPLIALLTPLPPFLAAFAVYGLGLGCVDAASAMQGVALQRSLARPVLGRLFAVYTAAAIVGAVLVAGAAASALPPIPLLIACAVAVGAAVAGVRWFSTERPVAAASGSSRLPRRGIWVFGSVIFAAFALDAAVSTWSTVYLADTLTTAAVIAPLGYAAYQGAVLVTRLATDALVTGLGRRALAVLSAVVAIVGCGVVAAVPLPAAAVVGFALAGVATGVLVPVAFAAAGDLDPARTDEVIARVNLFTYAGAVLGAVGVGLIGDATGLGIAFLLPGLALLTVLVVRRRFAPRAR
ncbi:MFS transporter [Microbacterium sp. AG1240]|uniref:MFS transporter n=1 Tax=Microbacterium sp. AG1240 TaxID=2183992 RepID=UPI00217D6C52|nr:MFS transporter [Microbacterium sp. AG1240]